MNEVEVNNVLKYMRELIGNQAQEIAVLKATLEAQTTANS
jgi:hypothetical protein